jgi:DNA (cytosine-5)-methyltransferase 1
MIRIIDLFCGTGAFSHAFKSENTKVVFANDIEKSAKEIYNLNFPEHEFKLDDLNNIETNDIPPHDILCGGFPCQPFSIAGQQLGFNDARANVFWKIVEIIKHHKPSIVVLENVKNLTSHDNGRTFQIIKDTLEKEQYVVKFKIIDTCKYSHLPQHRERIYIIACRDYTIFDNIVLDFPPCENRPIKEFLEEIVPSKYYYTERSKIYEMLSKEVTEDVNTNAIYQYRRVYVRKNMKNKCPTLTANMGGGGHNVPIIKDNIGIRKLTPRECFNLQGFPSDYKLPPHLSDSSLYKLAGNAVSIPIVQLIAQQVIKFYKSSK